jgi:histidinol dehydrogenase
MKIITNEAAQSVIDTISRPRQAADVRERVSEIISRVRTQGDEAICEYSRMFDDIDMGSTPRIMNREELELYVESNKSALTDIQIEAIDEAVRNVTFVAQKSTPQSWEEKAPAGQVIGERFIPMTRVACYVPQGSFPLVSTAIHTAAIAQACGVQEIVMVTSPSNDDLNVAVAYAALASGVTEIVFAGGAQGIAAVAYGTETISRVDFICGPGNQYVAEAKRQVFGDVGIDMVAGPSEVFVIADDNADAYAIACDLVAQAEHGSGSETSVLLSTSRDVIDGVARELENLKPQILNNAGFDKVFDESLYLVRVETLEDAATITNACAPEHLEIMVESPREVAEQITHSGAVFIGHFSAEPLGDFVAGPSHVLPTNGSARFSSGLSAASFFRRTSIIDINEESYAHLAPLASEMAKMEGLTGHALSSVARL